MIGSRLSIQRLAVLLRQVSGCLAYFCKIDENLFAPLYCSDNGQPNFPINILICLEAIKHLFDYTDEEILEQYSYNYQVNYAVGILTLGELPLAVIAAWLRGNVFFVPVAAVVFVFAARWLRQHGLLRCSNDPSRGSLAYILIIQTSLKPGEPL